MRVLLDENVDRKRKRSFAPAHEVVTVREHGWSGRKNGDLLRAAEREFDEMATPDANMRHQQRLPQYDLAVALITARSNKRSAIEPAMAEVNRVLRRARPGVVVRRFGMTRRCTPTQRWKRLARSRGLVYFRFPMPQSPRCVLIAAALLVGASPAVAAQPLPQAATPPPIEAVLRSDAHVVDSLFLGEGRSRWPFEFVRVAPLPGRSTRETWMRFQDPYGGTFFGPSTIVANLGEEAVAFQEGRRPRSVLFLPPALTLALLGLMAVGLTTLAGTPFFWYRRRLRAERGRRAAADLARRHLAEGRESERVRLARELHDGPVQDLYALRARLALQARVAGRTPDPEALARVLPETEAEVRRVAAELRAVSEALRPPALGPFGLAAALRALADRTGRAHPTVTLALGLDDDDQILPEDTRLALFRIAQEALNNALRHAGASHVRIEFRLHPGPPREASLEVADDGAGFAVPADLTAPAAAGHYGLAGMAERADALGAALFVTSRPGETRVRVRLPIP